MWSPTCKCYLPLISLIDLRAEPEVYDLDLPTSRLNQYILELDVSMYYVLCVHICQPSSYLSHNLLALFLVLSGPK